MASRTRRKHPAEAAGISSGSPVSSPEVAQCWNASTIYGKLENPPGHRIEHIFTAGAALAAGRSYRSAFVTAQAVPQKFGRNRQDLPVKAIDALRDYFRRQPAEPDEGLGRFIPV